MSIMRSFVVKLFLERKSTMSKLILKYNIRTIDFEDALNTAKMIWESEPKCGFVIYESYAVLEVTKD